MNYTQQQILDFVNTQLPLWIKKDEAVKDAVYYLVNQKFEIKQDSEDKFTKILNELKKDREEQTKKWDENHAVIRKMLDDIDKQREEQTKKWDENHAVIRKMLDDIDKQNAINEKMLDDIDKQNVINEKMLDDIDKQNVINEKMLANIEDLNTKYTVNIGAIGQRWGMASEASFRNALKAILEKSFPVKVINYNKIDTECIVYEKPTPVEIDIIIYNSITILCEIKASVSRGDVYDFIKKIHYYEKKEKVTVSRKIIISPMIDSDAIQEAEYYGMEVYSTLKEIRLL